ncbi:hypothetical protein [Devosia chinhatensis]|uniref:Uncharacterized protein n=1 Tax=Devosia chinhatensis TaxID=429727 RepID=A0A0F5FNE1_9HYPH|nr:hypothetical protein [Devosia chinhatensis]KKB09707.1 hypothetical protein VE26_07525 [Devosia chinhatensis]
MLAALAASLLASPAWATQGLGCVSPDGGTQISLSLGSAGGLAIVGARMQADGQSWVTDPAYGDGDIFTIGQRFADESGLKVDFFDDILNDRVAELRLSRAEDGADLVFAGTLRIVDLGAWALSCDEQ